MPHTPDFAARHIGISPDDARAMASACGYPSAETLADAAIPPSIRIARPLALPEPVPEREALAELRAIMRENRLARCFIGQGTHACHTPAVLQRLIIENPGWYTPYTPYQAEISQGRLEALLNFQTMIAELTGLEIANASLLDEPTAAAEAMLMCRALRQNPDADLFLVDPSCHPQTIALLHTRARPIGIRLQTLADRDAPIDPRTFGAIVQMPATDGALRDPSALISLLHEAGALAVVAADPLALALVKPPGELGADIAVGSAQRFGVQPGYGGPHAGTLATRDRYKRSIPGRLVGVSIDADGNRAYRLALQTREQHIRRERATSNICTAQALLAILSSMYAIHHGPDGLRAIALRVHALATRLADTLRALGHELLHDAFFDTLRVRPAKLDPRDILARARERDLLLRDHGDGTIGIALDETTAPRDIVDLAALFADHPHPEATPADDADVVPRAIPPHLRRSSPPLAHPIFHLYRTETELMRYIRRLEARDLSLADAMIPLGSCTMKLNAAAEMLPLSWPEVTALHPLVPEDHARGYARLLGDLRTWLAEITGLDAVSLQPNAGSQGEYAGLLAIRAYHETRGAPGRDVCLIPQSAHGTNPASAALAGYRVLPVACDPAGNIDIADLDAKIAQHAPRLAAIMVTYPSTHGVFESTIREICERVHAAGAQVYLDGANLNAQVGLCRPGDYGVDVCHLNLHKTFAIPHGGGGPGAGPIAVAAHLAPFLPSDPFAPPDTFPGPVAGAPHGSASILVIPWLYLRMMGPRGLADATRAAILNANYVAARLAPHLPILYRGPNGLVAHECILDLRPAKATADVEVEDVAKRLMDYGFHAPTMSWPVPGTLMFEPTESESRAELDRFCDAMISITREIEAVARGEWDRKDNPLKRAPHTALAVTADLWDRPYTRERAAFPAPATRERKLWPASARVDNVHGDRNPFCSCPPPEG